MRSAMFALFLPSANCRLLACMVLLGTAACTDLPQRPYDFWTDGGNRFTSGTPENAASDNDENTMLLQDIPQQWWSLYESEELDDLITAALELNPSINQIRARMQQAAAISDQQFATLLPRLDVATGGDKTYTDGRDPKSFSLLGAASYELDIWGRNRASFRSADANEQAALADMKAAAITLSASVVESWLTLLSLREEEALLETQLYINRAVLELQQRRYDSGGASSLEVLQQVEVLAQGDSQLPDIRSNIEIIEHQLLVLIGKPPSESLGVSQASLPDHIPLPDAGVPSRLLAERPDVNAAFMRVLSADWAAAAAQRNRLPNITLSADYSTSAAAVDLLFNQWLLEFATSAAAPVFDGGALSAEAIRQEALADERYFAYKDAVLNALREVEDALARNRFQQKKLNALNRQLQASESALEQAQISYADGNTTYLNVLTSLLNVQATQRQMVQARRDLALDRVLLYRALGLGHWIEETTEGLNSIGADNATID